jgi:hypothetical protein
MSQLLIRFAFLNIYLFALVCPTGEMTLARNQAKWPISQSLFKTAFLDFFSFKKTTIPLPSRSSKNEAVASKISAKQKSFRTLVLWWPKLQQDVADLPALPCALASFAPGKTPQLRSPLELFEILTI